jgi:hypothetical protein
MNADLAFVNRALLNVGNAPLSAEECAQADNAAWAAVKAFYLSTMLESLQEVPWTSAKRRRFLAPTRKPHKGNAGYPRAFDLPIDCAKPLELEDKAYFVLEGGLLYTASPAPALLYVSNGRRLIDQTEVSGGGAFRRPGSEYFTGGDASRNRRYEQGDNILCGGNAERTPPVPPPEAAEDFPEYAEVRFEAQFYLYWEKMLSAKLALKITDKPDLHLALFQEAAAISQNAQQASIAQSAAKRKAPALWADELGLR